MTLFAVPISKTSTPRHVLGAILDRVEGAGYDAIRARLGEEPGEPLDEIAAEEKLLAEFRIALRRKAAEAKAVCDAAVLQKEPPPRDLVAVVQVHGPGLLAVLEGPTKRALFGDTPKRASVFRGLTALVCAGGTPTADDTFAPDDFEFPSVNLTHLTDTAQRYVAKLKTNTQGERDTAAALLNEVRDGALLRLRPSRPSRPPVGELFRRIREELFNEGRELVLLVEDLTIPVAEVQPLVDAVPMAPTPGLAPVRVAITVAPSGVPPGDTPAVLADTGEVAPGSPAGEPRQPPEPAAEAGQPPGADTATEEPPAASSPPPGETG